MNQKFCKKYLSEGIDGITFNAPTKKALSGYKQTDKKSIDKKILHLYDFLSKKSF